MIRNLILILLKLIFIILLLEIEMSEINFRSGKSNKRKERPESLILISPLQRKLIFYYYLFLLYYL